MNKYFAAFWVMLAVIAVMSVHHYYNGRPPISSDDFNFDVLTLLMLRACGMLENIRGELLEP